MTETMWVHEPKDWTVTVEAGEYLIIDPCYAVPGDKWMALLSTCNFFSYPVGTVTIAGVTYSVLGFSTAYGDGEYPDQDGNTYSVDAGLIGLVPVELARLKGWPDDDWMKRAGRVVTFTRPTICMTEDGRFLKFGPVVIDTDPPYEDEDEDI